MPRLGLGLGLGLNSSLGGPAVALNPPVNTVAPAITGTPTVGQTLTVSNGTWTNSPTGYARQWQRGDSSSGPWTNISGATGTTYTLVSGDATKYVRAVVTATNSDGSNSAPATAVGPVAALPARTYAEFQTHIQGLATGGFVDWVNAINRAANKYYTIASTPTGSMSGSTWNSVEGAIATSGVDRAIQHALPSQSVFNEQVANTGAIYFELFSPGSAAGTSFVGISRNGYTSSGAAAGSFGRKITDLIRWDFTLNKAFRSNPSAGTAETEYTW